MKNVFDINVEQDGYDGKAFLSKQVSFDLQDKIEKASVEFMEEEQKSQISLPLIIVEIICMIIVFGVLRGIIEVGFAKAFSNAPFLMIGGIAAANVWLAIWLHGRKKEKKLFQYVEEENILEDIEKWEKLAQNELEMPEDKIEVDVLAEAYEMKKGKKKPLFTPVTGNPELNMYFKGENLCFADMTEEYSIPLADITVIEKIKKNVTIEEWHKEEDRKDPKYKKYKIATNNYGLLLKGYYSIQIQSMWGEFEIQMPDYEEEAVMMIADKAGKSIVGN